MPNLSLLSRSREPTRAGPRGWPPPGPDTSELYFVYPGQARDFRYAIWTNLQPGEYRATLRGTKGTAAVSAASGPFQVVP